MGKKHEREGDQVKEGRITTNREVRILIGIKVKAMEIHSQGRKRRKG